MLFNKASCPAPSKLKIVKGIQVWWREALVWCVFVCELSPSLYRGGWSVSRGIFPGSTTASPSRHQCQTARARRARGVPTVARAPLDPPLRGWLLDGPGPWWYCGLA
jgi:hypothetical protein